MQAADYLRKIPLFADLTSEEMVEVMRIARSVTFAAGETVFSQGSPADCLFVLEAGEGVVRVRDGSGQAREISRVAAGEVLGELGLVDGQARSADVVATQAIRAYRIDRAQFDAMRTALRPAAFKMLRRVAVTVSERLREINTTISDQLAQNMTPSAPARMSQPHAPPARMSQVNAAPARPAAAPQRPTAAVAPARTAASAPQAQPGPRVQALHAMLSRLSNVGHK